MPNEKCSQSPITRRTTLKGLGVGGISGLAISNTAVANPGEGKGPTNCDLVVPDNYTTIQGAVDAANERDTICVKEGTYPEQVVINKSLTLQSADGATPTIEPAPSPASFTIAESGPSWEPMVFAYGGSESDGTVSGSGTVEVTVTGFTLDGNGVQPAARRKPAVLYRNASGEIAENTIENVGVGGKETFGVLAYGNSEVTITGNSISDYERGGIGANGDGGAHPAPTVDIRGNTVTGSIGIEAAWGPNGIQVGYGVEGQVKNNEVRDNRYSDEGPVAAGILIFESDGVTVQRNTVENADIGLSCGSWGWLQPSADENEFTHNTVRDVEYGARLEAITEPYDGALTQSDPSVTNNKVVQNSFEDNEETDDPDGNVGIGVIVDDQVENEFTPLAKNNKLIQNTITGFETEIDDEGSETKVAPFEP